MKNHLPPQLRNLLGVIKKSIYEKTFRFSKHAAQRGVERSISFLDALYVLETGFHNDEKTSFDYKRRTWKYAIEGRTQDDIDARIIIAFDKGMVIITIIKLIKKRKKNL